MARRCNVVEEPSPMNYFWRILRTIPRIPALLLIGLVRIYQILVSPLLGERCRFYPSCSVYFIESVRKYGAIRGTLRGIWRICRCNPWNPGGYDPP
jgi:hypothetical protein